MRRDLRISFLPLTALCLFATAALSQPQAAEARAERAFKQAVAEGPLAVRALLADFPKGADLHIHLSGSVYAEEFIRAAGEDGICVDPVGLRFAKPPCDAPLVPAKDLSGNMTAANQVLYDKLIDSFSMRSYVPSSEWSGHDQFFATFEKFEGLNKRHVGEWVDDLTKISAMQNQQYDELMHTPNFGPAAKLGYEVGWPTETGTPNFAEIRQKLIEKGLRDGIAENRAEVRGANARWRELGKCGTPEAKPECSVEVRYIYQILRGFPPEQVFAQTLLGFETVEQAIEEKSDDWVGLNFVMPEDGYISMRDYSLQMKMIEYLHSVYPKVHISLHAGELAPGLVPPEGLRFHIREAVEVAHAERIGHGVDAMYEQDAPALLKEMAAKHVMVEINLSSNDGILNVKGNLHPLHSYLKAHVPVAFSTDDEGVSRIDITNEYARAASEQGLTYAELKQSARTGMEHNFLPGASLWAQPDQFTKPNAACAGVEPGAAKPPAGCKAFLDANEKAAAQWELERRFRVFEAKF
jgi:adenosine deaminase